MRFTIFASLASSIGFLLVEGAPAPQIEEEAAVASVTPEYATSYTVSKCVTYYGTVSTSSVPTTTSSNSVTFYDSLTSTTYPYYVTTTPVPSITYRTNSSTVYSTSTIYQTVPTATWTWTSVYTTTVSPYVTTSTTTAWLTTTSWLSTTSTIAAASNFLPLASHVYSLSATPNVLPALFAAPAATPYAQFMPFLNENETFADGNHVNAAASYPTNVRCGALLVVDSTYTVTATGTGTYTYTAPTPIRTSTVVATVTGTTSSTVQRGSTTVTRTATSTYSQRTTSTVLRSTTSTYTTTSKYAAATYYAACAPNNLVWGINKLEIPWPTNGGYWKSIFGFRAAYDCCVYGIKGNYGGSIFHSYTGECQLATFPPGTTCSALTKTFKFYTGCPTSGSWVVSNGNCGQGTWTGKSASDSEFFNENEHSQVPMGIEGSVFEEL